MRVYRIIMTGMIIMMLAIFYVHQKVEIIKSGYLLQKNRKYLSYLADQNSKLMYNLSKMESPRYLLASMGAEEVKFAGSGAEIAALVAEKAFDYLDGPILRVAAPFCPVPFSIPLEQAFIPSEQQIIDAVKKVME